MKRLKPSSAWLFFLSIVCLYPLIYYQKEGFHIAKASVRHAYTFQDNLKPPPSTLNQPFFYLGKGVQFYVFLGKDNKTVLKLFKHHHMGPSIDTIKRITPQLVADRLVTKREQRMRHLFQSAQIAFHDLREETEVFYTHLCKTEKELGSITLYDKVGTPHKLPLDTTEFILQKQAETLKQRLHTLLKQGKVEQAIFSIQAVQRLVENRSLKGIKCKDGNTLENCGFIGNTAVQIDVGSLTYRSSSTHPNPHKKAVMRCTLELLGFVKKYYPEHLHACKKQLLYENTL